MENMNMTVQDVIAGSMNDAFAEDAKSETEIIIWCGGKGDYVGGDATGLDCCTVLRFEVRRHHGILYDSSVTMAAVLAKRFSYDANPKDYEYCRNLLANEIFVPFPVFDDLIVAMQELDWKNLDFFEPSDGHASIYGKKFASKEKAADGVAALATWRT